jgi:hypothetical protein
MLSSAQCRAQVQAHWIDGYDFSEKEKGGWHPGDAASGAPKQFA